MQDTPSDHPISIDLRPKGPFARRLWSAVCPSIDRALDLPGVRRIYDRRPDGIEGAEFCEWLLAAFESPLVVDEHDVDRIPEDGPLVVVANHPFGGIEGIALAALLARRRSDVRVMANFILGRIPELRELFFLVDPFGGDTSVRSNLGSTRTVLRHLRAGGVLGVFPAGEVAHFHPSRLKVDDPVWSPQIAGLVRHATCSVLPVYFPGRNRRRFQAAGLVHPRLRTAMLARELTARTGSPLEARVGNAIPWKQLSNRKDDAETIAYLRSRTFILSRRPPSRAIEGVAVQPRETPSHARPLVEPSPPAELAREIGELGPESLLVDSDDQAVYVASVPQIPTVLHEIGRLRELTFREVGEGTGREIDLDRFDSTYEHLFVWDKKKREIIGAYRIGRTDELMRAGGIGALYTATLFRYKRKLFEAMGPALEMGRSFIRPEHQKSFAGLMLLWKGIGEYVVRNPGHPTLFGPVSISADYQSASQKMIAAFLRQNRYAHDWSRWVRPLTPSLPERGRHYRPGLEHLRTLEDVSTYISEIEADQKGVPILLKQYLKLGGRLLGFNVDPAFSNVLDVLILVDLRKTQPRILSRYMGRDGAKRFLARHAETGAEGHTG